MRLVEPLARSSVVLASQMRSEHPLLGAYGKSGVGPVLIFDIDDAGEIMNSILDALRRQVGAVGRARTRPSTEYRGALAAALSHLLEYLISPRDPEELLLQSEEPRDDSSLAMLGRFCSAYKEATAGYRQMFLSIFQHKYESVVAVLAHDGCTESTTPKWRVACFSALVQLLKTLQAEDGSRRNRQRWPDSRWGPVC